MDRWSSWSWLAVLAAMVVIVVASRREPAAAPDDSPVMPSGSPSTAPPSSAADPAPDDGPGPLPAPSSSGAHALPPDAPMAVRLGVIQFSYRGAELAPADAPPRAAALERARSALAAARQDFAKTVALGDRSSGADLGTIPRGVLEPEVEQVVFSLAPGAIADEPLATPRGFWIVQRIR